MANIQEILQVSGGSLKTAENIALQRATHDAHFWLDLALILSVQGQFAGARQAQTQYMNAFPNCPRVRFGMAPFALMDGELQSGLKLLEFGRGINCWGARDFNMGHLPCWDGESNLHGKTVILHSEGGIGDEMINLRAVRWVQERGARCIVACTAGMMRTAAAARPEAVVDCKHADAVHADCWLPAMSAPRLFGRTWKNLWPGQYVRAEGRDAKIWEKIIPKSKERLNIGLRWRGNPRFEHEQMRCFPVDLLFKATDIDANLYSLQKDEVGELPERVVDLEPFLTTWSQTAAAMARMDLVITSCTAIAHLAGAMEIPAWVIVPVLPYYVWAELGQKTSWYPSISIYRQECYNQWDGPFKQIKRDLEKRHEHHASSH